MAEVTAADIIAAMDRVEAAEEAARWQWSAVSAAKSKVTEEESRYEYLLYEAETARDEYKELLDKVREEARNVEA